MNMKFDKLLNEIDNVLQKGEFKPSQHNSSKCSVFPTFTQRHEATSRYND